LEDGQRLLDAIAHMTPLPILKDIRERLDVVPSGEKMENISIHEVSWILNDEMGLGDRLNELLADVADQYDLIVIDTPPGNQIIIKGALEIATNVVIPTGSDQASLDGVKLVAKRFMSVRKKNPDLKLAGIVLFAINTRAQRIERDLNATLETMFGEDAPIFKAKIRDAKAASVDARKHGLLISELAGATTEMKKQRLSALRTGQKAEDPLYSRNATQLAHDYMNLTKEILHKINLKGEAE
jgi:cellulose biosynthesis protein BcsQ